MTRKQRIALALILASGGFSLFFGFALERFVVHDGMVDFKGIYYSARCLLQHNDPYREGEPLRVYLADGGDPRMGEGLHENLTWFINLPAILYIIAPITLLPWGPAHLFWMFLTCASLCLAAFLMWNQAGDSSRGVALFWVCFLLFNSAIVFAIGNPAGIVVALCVVAVWSFLKERFVPAGIFCLSISLAIKPHDAGLVWLYFLLAGGAYRKRALQTLVLTVALCLPAILSFSQIAPHWMQELHSNLLAQSVPGGGCDPAPDGQAFPTSPGMILDLQSTISAFQNDPRVYNTVSFVICGALLLAWSVRAFGTRFSPQGAWLALAAVAPLTILMCYHRPYDAKLLLLAVPASAMLWAEGGPIGRFAFLVTAAGIVLTSDIPLLIFAIYLHRVHISGVGLWGKILSAIVLRPTPLVLLAMSIFYLWVYLRRAPERGIG